jgi:hypothetical protein
MSGVVEVSVPNSRILSWWYNHFIQCWKNGNDLNLVHFEYILWHLDPLLGEGREISSYTRAIT